MINQPPESRFAGLLKPFFDTIDPEATSILQRSGSTQGLASVSPTA
jgi:hypothetical protein